MSSGSIVLVVIVAAATVMGFLAARWGNANLSNIDEWALGGRHFGTVVSWFLLGGDLYTAYTFIAVPALVYGVGALGFFAVPYATISYPISLLVMLRFWGIARKRGYVTTADFVRDRFGCRTLEICIAVTGVLAAMPYIALQLVGMKTVFLQLGGALAEGNGLPALAIGFLLLAAFTYSSGIRAPAMIAFVKDALIYITVIAAIVVIPAKLGGWAHIMSVSANVLATRPKPGSTLLAGPQYFTYATMVLGSALSIYLYPHSVTSFLAAKSKLVIARNATLLPIYSVLLGLLALLGFCAIAAGIHVAPSETSRIVPLLFAKFFPDWFAGVADAAVVIGALVPAAVMCIGAANLIASNVLREFTPERTAGQTQVAKLLTVAMAVFGLILVLTVPVPYAIDFQLLGGALMLQIFPAFVLGLWARWFVPKALVLGWGCGFTASCAMAYAAGFTSTITFHFFGAPVTGFIALYGLLINLAVTTLTTLALRAAKADAGEDRTLAADYA